MSKGKELIETFTLISDIADDHVNFYLSNKKSKSILTYFYLLRTAHILFIH